MEAQGLTKNLGGVSTMLAKGAYSQPALVPPMPWLSQSAPARPGASVTGNGSSVRVTFQSGDRATSRYAVQARFGNQWRMVKIVSAGSKSVDLPALAGRLPDAVAVSAVDRFGNSSTPVVMAR